MSKFPTPKERARVSGCGSCDWYEKAELRDGLCSEHAHNADMISIDRCAIVAPGGALDEAWKKAIDADAPTPNEVPFIVLLREALAKVLGIETDQPDKEVVIKWCRPHENLTDLTIRDDKFSKNPDQDKEAKKDTIVPDLTTDTPDQDKTVTVDLKQLQKNIIHAFLRQLNEAFEPLYDVPDRRKYCKDEDDFVNFGMKLILDEAWSILDEKESEES